MRFKLTSQVALDRMMACVRGVLSGHMDPDQEYPPQELMELCQNQGLLYTLPQYQQIAQLLIAEGFLERV